MDGALQIATDSPYERVMSGGGRTHRWLLRSSAVGGTGDHSPAGVASLVARVLRSRGVTDRAAMHAFCNPSLRQMHDPGLMPGLEKATARMLAAATAGQRIVIYGDYDVDGICAASILFHTLRAVTPRGIDPRISTYVPHRLDEGYGLHAEAIEQLSKDGAELIISVDCGVTAFGPAETARKAGVDLIITDHHALPPPAQGLPDVHSVVHPRLAGSAYPCPELCGAGVAFKIAWRLATLACGSERVSDHLRALLIDLLALAALGTIADVVPLVDENRIIARFGLDHLKRCSLPGVAALIDAAGLGGEEIDSERAGFALAPRLNACGRMGHARDAMELFTVADAVRAGQIAVALNKHNHERRETEQRIFDQACEMAEIAGMTGPARRSIVLAHDQWHAGVVGIVCSRLIGRFHRPTILLQRGQASSHGSGRSIDGFNLHAGLSKCAGLLERFGGHEMAAGLVVRHDQFDEFVRRFEEVASEGVSQEMLTPSLTLDCEARMDELTPDTVRQLAPLGPFGRGNPRPCVLIRGVRPLRDAETMGAHGTHLSVLVAQPGNSGTVARPMRMVGWKMGETRDRLRGGRAVDLAVHPKINLWNGVASVEAEICDIGDPTGA